MVFESLAKPLMVDGQRLKATYALACPSCTTPFAMAPSPAMVLGENKGVVECPKCSSEINVHIGPDGNMVGDISDQTSTDS